MKKAKNAATLAVPMPQKEIRSVHIEPIQNGFLVTHSSDGPKGYKTTKVYHPEMPHMPVPPKGAAKKGPGGMKPSKKGGK